MYAGVKDLQLAADLMKSRSVVIPQSEVSDADSFLKRLTETMVQFSPLIQEHVPDLQKIRDRLQYRHLTTNIETSTSNDIRAYTMSDRADLLWSMGQREQALEEGRRAAEFPDIKPDQRAELQCNYANKLTMLDRQDGALHVFAQVIKCAGRAKIRAYAQRAKIYLSRSDEASALAEWNNALSLQGPEQYPEEAAKAYVARGEYFLERGQELAAERDFTSVVELQYIHTDQLFIARLRLGFLSIRRKQCDAARIHADEALKLKSLTRFKEGKLLLLRALAYRGLYKYDLASLDYKNVLSLPELDANLRKMAEEGERDLLSARGAEKDLST